MIVMAQDTTKFHLHLVSDSTGGTLNNVLKACLAQFENVEPEEHLWNLVRNERQLKRVLDGIRGNPGPVMFTLVDEELAAKLKEGCHGLNVPVIPILQPVIGSLSAWLGMESRALPGLQHILDEEYFRRMDAMDYTLHHDDGQKTADTLSQADVILVGVSRTSKTPTSIYLANRGIRTANVPYVVDVPLPENIRTLKGPLFVGLTAAPDRLVEIRRNRLKQLGERRETDYLGIDQVEDEVREARRFYTQMGWPVIDVTRRSVEETAAEIMVLLSRRREQEEAAKETESETGAESGATADQKTEAI